MPARDKYLCELLSRQRVLPSGLILTDRIKDEKNDTVCKCLGVGDPGVKDCYLCHDRTHCKKKCAELGKPLPIVARRGDVIYFKRNFGVRIKYEGRKYVFLRNQDIIAIERQPEEGAYHNLIAVGSMVIVKLKYAEKQGRIVIPDSAQLYSGDYHGEVVSVGPDYPDKRLKAGDRLVYLRNEGYEFQGYFDRERYYSVKEKWCYGKG